jgi:hypothetical protein
MAMQKSKARKTKKKLTLSPSTLDHAVHLAAITLPNYLGAISKPEVVARFIEVLGERIEALR